MVNFILNRLKELMHKANLTVHTLAKLCDIPRSTFYNYLSGKTAPTITFIEQVCAGLKITVMEFFEPYIEKYYRGKGEQYLKLLCIFDTIPSEDKEAVCTIILSILSLTHNAPVTESYN